MGFELRKAKPPESAPFAVCHPKFYALSFIIVGLFMEIGLQNALIWLGILIKCNSMLLNSVLLNRNIHALSDKEEKIYESKRKRRKHLDLYYRS